MLQRWTYAKGSKEATLREKMFAQLAGKPSLLELCRAAAQYCGGIEDPEGEWRAAGAVLIRYERPASAMEWAWPKDVEGLAKALRAFELVSHGAWCSGLGNVASGFEGALEVAGPLPEDGDGELVSLIYNWILPDTWPSGGEDPDRSA